MNRLKTILNVLLVTSVVGLALSYVTLVIHAIPDLNFLEAVGVYCLTLPITQLLKSPNGDTEI